MIANDAGDGLYGLEERMVSGHLTDGTERHDIVFEEGVLASDGAISAQRVAIDGEQGGQGDGSGGDESQGHLAVSAVARHEGKPEHGIGLDAGGDAKGHG